MNTSLQTILMVIIPRIFILCLTLPPFKQSHCVWEVQSKELLSFAVFKAITNIATAGPNEFYAGQNFNSDVETPQELRSSRKYRLLPLCVMPEERGSIKKVFQWLASLENVSSPFFKRLIVIFGLFTRIRTYQNIQTT